MAIAASLSIAFSGSAVAAAAPVAPASAVSVVAATKSSKISIKTIPTKVVKGSAKATIKPSVSAAKGVKITSKVLTVKQGKKTLVSKKPYAVLKPGTYAVTTTVKYKVGSKSYTSSKTQTLRVKKSAAKKPSVNYTHGVTPGAFCSGAGSKGIGKKNGKVYTCKTKSGDSRLRWRQ